MGYSANGRTWPTRRMRDWAVANNITTVASIDNWLTTNADTITKLQARIRDLLISLVESTEGGENGG